MSTSDREITLERLMSDLGRERYWNKVRANAAHGHATRSVATRYLLRESITATTSAIREWRTRVLRGNAGTAHAWAEYLEGIPSDVLAFIAVRCILDVSAKPMGMAAASNLVASALEEEVNFLAVKNAAPKLWRDLKRRMVSKTDPRFRKKLLKSAATNIVMPLVVWERRAKLAIGASMIELVAQNTGLIEIQRIPQRKHHIKSVVTPTLETLEWLESSHEAHEAQFPFYLPTLELPVPWDSPFDGGYHTGIILRQPLVKTGDRKTLELLAARSGNMRPVYEAVNAIQDTAWEISPVVHEVAKHFWDSGIAIAGFPERVDDAPVPRPPDMDPKSPEGKEWRVAAAIRHQRVLAARSKRILTAKCMFMAERFEGQTFFYPHMADFRGRLYPRPFFLQPQGSSLARGLLRFASGGAVRSEESRKWFTIHGANCYGVDKVPFPARMAWVKEHTKQIQAVHRDPVDNRWWADASKPWEFLAWCLEYSEWLDNPQMESRIPIAMDGSNNGLQLFSLLMRDPVGAAATNCSGSDAPRDIYQEVADAVTARLLEDTDPLAAQWVSFCGGRVPREAVKRQVMTMPYGCSFHSCIQFTRDWYEKTRKEKGSTPFERGYGCSNYLAKYIWQAIGASVGKARECMDWLRDIATRMTERGEHVRWTTPSGFPVRQEYTKYLSKRVKTTVGETIRRVAFRDDTTGVAVGDHVSGIAPNFVHSLDAALLVASVNRAKKAGVSSFSMIHDSYGVPACDAPIMASALREAAAEMFSIDLLQEFRKEILSYAPRGARIPEVPELGDLDPQCVLKSPYFFA